MEPGTIVQVIGKTTGAAPQSTGSIVHPSELQAEYEQLCSHLLKVDGFDAVHEFVAVKFCAGGTDGFYMKQNLETVWSASE